ncbi:MAG: response regulator [Planctomycetota bacterium]|nr:response regulator [Planctomycetota bacterium]
MSFDQRVYKRALSGTSMWIEDQLSLERTAHADLHPAELQTTTSSPGCSGSPVLGMHPAMLAADAVDLAAGAAVGLAIAAALYMRRPRNSVIEIPSFDSAARPELELFDHAPHALILVRGGLVRRHNRAAELLLCRNDESASIVGTSFPPEGQPALLDGRSFAAGFTEASARALTSGQASFEAEMVDASGRRFAARLQLSALPAPRQDELIVSIEDGTEAQLRADALRRARDAASAANRAKSDYLATMSHEFRTPLTAIIGFADALLEEGDISRAPRVRLDAIATLRRNAQRLVVLVEDVLEYANAESGRMSLDLERCSLAELVAEAADACGSQRIEVHSSPVFVRVDRNRFKRTVAWLLTRDLKSSDGKLRVVCGSRPPSRAPGEPPVAYVEIQGGRPHARPETRPLTADDGDAIGVATLHRIVSMMGGSIGSSDTASWIELPLVAAVPGSNSAANAGTLPSGASPQAGAHANAASGTHTGGSSGGGHGRQRVLVVDDAPENQRLIEFLLGKLGCQVFLASDGQQALEQVSRGEAFELILMDMQMPVMDGYEATRRLRASGYDGAIVALTANAMAGESERCLEAGCDAYATKPVGKAQLGVILEQWSRASNSILRPGGLQAPQSGQQSGHHLKRAA